LFQRTKFIFDYGCNRPTLFSHLLAIESWYEILGDHTPKTEFVPLSLAEAEAFYEQCHWYYCGAKPNSQVSTQKKTLLKKIEERVDSKIKLFNGKAFVKLSTRSPKDSLTSGINERMKVAFIEELKRSDSTPNGDLCAFSAAGRNAALVTTGAEACELLQISSRVREDLMRALEFPESFVLQIIVREWIPMKPQQEFRAFVFEKEMTAISQYCYFQYYPELVQNKEKLKNRMSDFWNSIKHKVPQKSCIIDFLVQDDNVMIIELNPFFNDTSACLFSWREAEDRKIIQQGPLQIRVLESPIQDPLTALPSEWRRFTEDYRAQFKSPVKMAFLAVLIVSLCLSRRCV